MLRRRMQGGIRRRRQIARQRWWRMMLLLVLERLEIIWQFSRAGVPEKWKFRMRLEQRRPCCLIDRPTRFFVLDHAQPFALHLRHGRGRANNAETVVNEPHQVIEVTSAVFGLAEPFSYFLGACQCCIPEQVGGLKRTNSCSADSTFGRPFFLFISSGIYAVPCCCRHRFMR